MPKEYIEWPRDRDDCPISLGSMNASEREQAISHSTQQMDMEQDWGGNDAMKVLEFLETAYFEAAEKLALGQDIDDGNGDDT